MARVGKKEVKSSKTVEIKCKDCGREFSFTEVTYVDGTKKEPPKHSRCEGCQTRHLCNLRVDKHSMACKHIANLKLRLSEIERQAVIDHMTNDLNAVYEVFNGTTVRATGFDLAQATK